MICKRKRLYMRKMSLTRICQEDLNRAYIHLLVAIFIMEIMSLRLGMTYLNKHMAFNIQNHKYSTITTKYFR